MSDGSRLPVGGGDLRRGGKLLGAPANDRVTAALAMSSLRAFRFPPSLHAPTGGWDGMARAELAEQPGRAARRHDAVISGMVGKGLGLEAICAILGVSPDEVLDRAVELSLPTPHDRPMRCSTHPKAWSVVDMRLMIECWLDRWDPGSMAALFDRSKGSIYALKRRLNLPPRQRSKIRRPGGENYVRRKRERLRTALCGTTAAQTPSQAPEPPTRLWEAERPSLSPADGRGAIVIERRQSSPLAALLSGSLCKTPLLAPAPLPPPSEGAVTVGLAPQPDGTVLRIERKAGRKETLWTLALDLNLSFRHFARQHYKAIARDLGLSAAAVRSRVTRLELPSFSRVEQVQHFDPGVVAASIRQSGCVLRRCRGSARTFHFWAPRNGPRISRDAKMSKRFRNAASGLDDACSFTL